MPSQSQFGPKVRRPSRKKSRARYKSPFLMKSYKEFKRTQQHMQRPMKQNGIANCSNASSKNQERPIPSRQRGVLSSKKLDEPQRLKVDLNTSPRCLKTQSHLKEKEGSHDSSNVRRSNLRQNLQTSMVGLVHEDTNVNAPKQFNNHLSSWLKRLPNLHEGDEVTVGRDSNGPNLSTSKNLIGPDEESDKKRYEITNGKDKETQGQSSEASLSRVRRGDVYSMCGLLHQQEDLLNVEEAPNSSLLMKDNQVMQYPQSDLGNNPYPIFGKDLRSNRKDVAYFTNGNMKLKEDPLGRSTLFDSSNRSAMLAKGDARNTVLDRKRVQPLLGEQSMAYVDDEIEEAENSRPMNKRRRFQENGCHPNDSMPFISEHAELGYSQPIGEPTWSGIFKVASEEYVSVAAHLSTKSCEEVWTLSKSLLPVVELAKLSRWEVWPKSWEASRPTDDSIGLYFLPHKTRPDEGLAQLVKEVMENDIALRAVIGEAEMLIFPSTLLPEPYHTFQSKHYLWGLFKRKNDIVTEVKEQGSHQPDEEEREDSDNETLMERTTRLRKQWLSVKPRGARKEAAETGKQQAVASHVLRPNMDPEGAIEQDAEKELAPTLPGSSAMFPAKHGAEACAVPPASPAATSEQEETNLRHGVPLKGLFVFIVRQKTEKLEQIFQQLNHEGALVAAVKKGS